MAIDYIKIENINGARTVLNQEESPFPVTSLEYEVQTRRDVAQKVLEAGNWPARQFDDVRTIHMEGDILVPEGGSYMQLVRQLSAAFVVSPQLNNTIVGTFRIKYSDFDDELFADFALDGHPDIPLEALSPQYGHWSASLVCDDPNLYFTRPQLYATGVPTSVGGVTLDGIVLDNLVFTGTSGGVTDIVNIGDVEVAPQVTFFGPCSSPAARIMQDETGLDLTLKLNRLTLNAGEYATINFLTRQAVLSSGASAYPFIDPAQSIWWKVPAGISTFQFFSSEAAPPAHAEISFSPAVIL